MLLITSRMEQNIPPALRDEFALVIDGQTTPGAYHVSVSASYLPPSKNKAANQSA